MRTIRRKTGGLTLIEVMLAMLILASVMLAVGKDLVFLARQTSTIQDRTFASQKAVQMMEELRGLISNANDASVGVLDDYDDGSTTSPILTSRRDVSDPADPLSGNGSGKFVRRINILAVPNEPMARRIYVRVFRKSDMKSLAETVSVIRTINNQFVPTQVFDVYVIALENVPGWWVSLPSMKPMFDNVIQDLQTRNPGLEWRVHWITRLAYGRDPYYTPYINETTLTDAVSPPSVYFYPGSMTKPGFGLFSYYAPSHFSARMNRDGTVVNPDRYSLADQFNNAVRYPDEIAMHNKMTNVALAAGEVAPEMTLRMLLEKLNSSPTELQNSLIINLHGELIPFPPIRNYSDPAKSPYLHPNVRVVTHPEKLQYSSGQGPTLRVYSYVTNPDSWPADSTLPEMTVYLPGHALTASQVNIKKVVGNDTVNYIWQSAVSGTDFTLTNPVTGGTLITLLNSPLRHPSGPGGGLETSERLYGLEYIPCQPGHAAVFTPNSDDLAASGTTSPKNTARWTIAFTPGSIADGVLTAETRIGTDMTVGVSTEPTNISRTYTWVGVSAPVTERFQFMGDPRHLPYVDVKFNKGYNWFFRSVDPSKYASFTEASDGWDGPLNIDVPRFFQLYRQGLLETGSIYSSMTGFSNYYAGIGGEMGYDGSNGFPSGLPIIRTPWDPTGTTVTDVDEITGDQATSHTRLISNAANTWWGLYWLGELWPDEAYGHWESNGNLPVGPGKYYRALYSSKGFGYDPQRRTSQKGAASFFNGNLTGAGTDVVTHDYDDSAISNATTLGLLTAQDFNFPILSAMNTARPFRLDHGDAGFRPVEWSNAVYSAVRTTVSTLEAYYDPIGYSTTHDSSALLRIALGTKRGNVLMNGLSPQINFGAAQISKLCTIDMIRGFQALGAPAVTVDRIPQVPLISISSPTATEEFNNPSTIAVSWSSIWRRWDGNNYTEAYPPGYSESTPVIFNVKYSANNGRDWAFIQDGTPAKAGVRDASKALTAPYTWNVAALPRGSYIIRIEGYRDARDLHYTYHQRKIYVFR